MLIVMIRQIRVELPFLMFIVPTPALHNPAADLAVGPAAECIKCVLLCHEVNVQYGFVKLGTADLHLMECVGQHDVAAVGADP